MKDSYAQIVNSSVGKKVAGALGLPQPVELRRYAPGQDLLNDRKVLVVGGQSADGLAETLLDWNLEVRRHPESRTRYGAIIADFTDAATPADLQNGALAVGAALRSLGACGRVIVLGRSTDHEDDESSPELVATQKAVEGFMRSLAHEMRKGSTCNLLKLAPELGPEHESVQGPLKFLLSARSAYISGQPLSVE